MELKIVWNYDEYDCEDCGRSDSVGATATLAGEVVFDVKSAAYCFGGPYVTKEEILEEVLLKKFGVKIIEER